MNPDQQNIGVQPTSTSTMQPAPSVQPTPTVQPTDPRASQFMNAVNYAKQNPNSPFASDLQRRIQSGQMNDYLQAAGFDPTRFVKQQPTAPTSQDVNQQHNQEVFGSAQPTDFIGGVLKSTIGSQGIGGLGGRPIVSAMTAGAEGDVAQHSGQLGQVTQALLNKIKTMSPDDPKRQGLLDVVKENQKAFGISSDVMNSLENVQETQGQNVGNALNAAATLAGGAGAGEAVANTGAKTIGQQILHGAITGAEVGGAQGAGNALQDKNATAGDVAKGTVIGGVSGAVLGGAAEGVLGGASRLASGVDTVKGLINGKTLDEILATPENQVYKLSAPERSAYFDAQQSKIVEGRATADAQVKADLTTKSQASQKQAEELNRQLQVASRDKVLELRPKIRSAMAEQSATYRNLVDEAIAPVKDTPVKARELVSFVDSRYPDNPELASATKDKLGLNEKTTNPLIGASGKFENPTGDTTLGKIYDQTKALKQDISAGASKGTKVFTPDDKLTDDAIATLADYMKSKGVDLSAANKFWAQYAPVRNQLVAEAKPFLQAPTQTKMFANTLMRVAKGTDVNNENFISQVEDLVGQPVTKENKAILSRLDANEKEQLANEVAAQEKLLENNKNAKLANENLSAQQFETNRLANRRTILKRIFYTAGGLGIDKIIKNYTGIGI